MYINDLFVYKDSCYSFSKTNTVEVPQVRTTYHGLHSFRYAGATLWNELPNELRKVSNISQFKSLINSCSGFLFRSEFFFRKTRELEYLFFLSRQARIFFPKFNIRLYDKNSESDFFFPPPKL